MNCLKRYPLTSNDHEMSMELIRSEIVDAEEEISYTTYGMRVVDKQGQILFSAEDIDTNEEAVEQFIRLCSDNDVHLIHLPDLLDDFLGQ